MMGEEEWLEMLWPSPGELSSDEHGAFTQFLPEPGTETQPWPGLWEGTENVRMCVISGDGDLLCQEKNTAES